MTEGNPTRLIILFSIPMLIGNLFQQLYSMVDSIIVGQFVSANAFAAVGSTGSVTFFFFALCNGIGTGGSIITARFFGANDHDGVKKCISNVAYIMLVFPLAMGVLSFACSGPLLKLLDTPETIYDDALAYMRLMCIGIVFVSIYNYVSSILRALGDSKSPLYFLILSCVLNTILDFVFIYFLGMGVVGAGVATLISQLTSGVLSLMYAMKYNPYFKLSRHDLSIDPAIIKSSVRLGIPLSLQYSLIAISIMALQRVVNSFGDVAVAAYTATSRIEMLISQPYQTLSAALSTYCSQNYGAGKIKRIFEGYRKTMKITIIYALSLIPIVYLFGSHLCSIFFREPNVIRMGASALRIVSLFYTALGVIYVVRAVLNGIGDAFFALLNGIVEVIGRFIFPILLTSIPLFGVWGIWWSVAVVWMLAALASMIRFAVVKKKIQVPLLR